MKIKSSVDLIQAIDDDFNWRRKEISTLIDMLKEEDKKNGSKKNKYKINCIIKSIICLSYSNWEGFVKTSSRYYLEYIKFLGLDNKSLSNNLKASFTAFLRTGIPLKERIETYQKIYNDPNFKMYIPIEELTNTHDNLNFDYLEELSLNIDLDYSQFSTKSKFIDESLLNYRNKFAHGENNYEVDINGAEYIAKETLGIISLFRNEIQNMIELSKYKMA